MVVYYLKPKPSHYLFMQVRDPVRTLARSLPSPLAHPTFRQFSGHLRAAWGLILPLCTACWLAGCNWFIPEPGIGKAVAWPELEGWRHDRHAESWPALLRSCEQLGDREDWAQLCQAASTMPGPGDEEAREFYEKWFTAHVVYATGGKTSGLITGYYEPELKGRRQADARYRYPIYGRPDDLLIVDLAGLYPELKGKRLRGRLVGNKVVPYFSRAELHADPVAMAGNELVWVDDLVGLFFLHIQGSGRVRLRDGSILRVGYADQNGHPYRSIGRELIDMGELEREEVDMFSIREWLQNNPSEVDTLFERNPSYVFFTIRNEAEGGPTGSLNVALSPQRSIAVDRNVIPLGSPVWLDTILPESELPYRRLVLAQDTGGAIKGHVRADLFWGHGEHAERMAGLMKQSGRLYVLQPNTQTVVARGE